MAEFSFEQAIEAISESSSTGNRVGIKLRAMFSQINPSFTQILGAFADEYGYNSDMAEFASQFGYNKPGGMMSFSEELKTINDQSPQFAFFMQKAREAQARGEMNSIEDEVLGQRGIGSVDRETGLTEEGLGIRGLPPMESYNTMIRGEGMYDWRNVPITEFEARELGIEESSNGRYYGNLFGGNPGARAEQIRMQQDYYSQNPIDLPPGWNGNGWTQPLLNKNGMVINQRGSKIGEWKQLRDAKGRFSSKVVEHQAELEKIIRDALVANFTLKGLKDATGTLKRALDEVKVRVVPQEKSYELEITLPDAQRPARSNDPARSVRDYGPPVFFGHKPITPTARPWLRFNPQSPYASTDGLITSKNTFASEGYNVFEFTPDQLSAIANSMATAILAGVLGE